MMNISVSHNYRMAAHAVGIILTVFLPLSAHGDRNVIAPSGLIVPPNSIKLEGLAAMKDFATNMEWVNIGMPQQIIGLELEAQRFITHGNQRNAISAQYSLTGNAFTDLAPAFSVGVKDLLRTGLDGQSAYFVMTKGIRLSTSQERILRDFKITTGYGTSRMGGPFGGVQTQLAIGAQLNAEFVAHHVNASFAVPLNKHFNAKIYNLNREMYYGLSFSLIK